MRVFVLACVQPQPQFHVVTSSHVVAPWRWPRYYPEEWLRAVTPAHTHYSVELRHPDGMFLASLDLEPTSFHHACRDLAVLRFEDPVDALATLREFNYSPLKLLADRPGAELSIGDVSVCCLCVCSYVYRSTPSLTRLCWCCDIWLVADRDCVGP
jgi:hypothetical protein